MHYLALCCIAKDEDPFLKEWLTYHAMLGVEHFYIYDNMSAQPIAKLLEGFADKSRVTIRRIAGKAMQLSAYANCLEDFGSSCQWIGFIDVDEFICPTKDADLRVLLSEFEPYAALAMTWTMMSSSGHITRPRGPVIKNYRQRMPYAATAANLHIKCIVRPSKTLAVYKPHVFRYAPGEVCVNDEHYPVPVDAPFTFSNRRLVSLYHYFYRSQQDYEEKLLRGRADVGDAIQRNYDPFYAQAQIAVEEDRGMDRFIPGLEKALSSPKLVPAKTYRGNGDSLFAYIEDAQAFLKVGQLEKAAASLSHALPQYSDKVDIWILRALIARQAGFLERAERFLRIALSLEETPNTYLELIALKQRQKRYSEAAALQVFLNNLLTIRGLR